MKTESNHKQSILLIVFLIAILALAAIFFTACMSDEEAFDKYGRENAFSKNSFGSIIHVESGSQINFYLDPSLNGKYLSATKYAIAKANTLTSKITITGNGSSSSQYSISQSVNTESSTTYATTYWWSVMDGTVIKAKIVFYSNNMSGCSERECNYTAMHEIGHVLGLTHPNNDVKDDSVMVQSGNAAWPRLTDYGRFDRENIHWYYGE